MNQFIRCCLWAMLLMTTCWSSLWGQQEQLPITRINGDIYDVRFLDDNSVLAVGSDGLLMRSEDAGISWHMLPRTFANDTLHGMAFFNSEIGTVVGSAGLIARTTDGGHSWTRVETAHNDILYDVKFFDEHTGIAVGSSGAIVRTTDGGHTWALVESGVQEHLRAVATTDINTAIIAGIRTLLRSEDRGITWEKVDAGIDFSQAFLFDAVGSPDGTVVIVGATPMPHYALRSDDHGNSWAQIPIPTTAVAVAAPTAGQLAYALGENSMYVSANGGQQWQNAVLEGQSTNRRRYGFLVRALAFADANIGIAVGSNRSIVRTDDGGLNWRVISYLTTGADDFNSVHFTDELHGFIGASDGSIYKTTDGGVTWDQRHGRHEAGDFDANIWDFVFLDPDRGFAVGSGETIVQRPNAESPWSIAHSGGRGFTQYGVCFAEDDIGVAVGFLASEQFDFSWWLTRTNDGGDSWLAEQVNSVFGPREIYCLSSTRWVAVGADRESDPRQGMIAVTDDGGDNWDYRSFTSVSQLSEIEFVDQHTGFVAGFQGAILKTDDGGATWDIRNIDTAASFSSIDFLDAQRGCAVAFNGVVAHTRDGGATWEVIQQDFLNASYRDVQYLNDSVAIAVGSGGVVSKVDLSQGPTSSIGSVERNSRALPQVHIRSIAPMPASDVIRADLSLSSNYKPSDISVKVLTYLGREVLDVSDVFAKTPSVNGVRQAEFSVSGLENGLYILHVFAADISTVQSIMIVR